MLNSFLFCSLLKLILLEKIKCILFKFTTLFPTISAALCITLYNHKKANLLTVLANFHGAFGILPIHLFGYPVLKNSRISIERLGSALSCVHHMLAHNLMANRPKVMLTDFLNSVDTLLHLICSERLQG